MVDVLGDLEFWLRLGGAALAGAIIGVIAALRHRPAGVGTHLNIAVASAVFVLTWRDIGFLSTVDPLRAVQGVAQGVGFVGAASVLKKGSHIVGVTTAARVWLAAALGCEAALGRPLRAVAVAGVIAVISLLLRRLEEFVLRRGATRRELEKLASRDERS